MPTISATTRRHTLLKWLVTAFIALAIVAGIGFATGLIKIYDGPLSAGVVIGTDHANIGFEWYGAPGVFVNSD